MRTSLRLQKRLLQRRKKVDRRVAARKLLTAVQREWSPRTRQARENDLRHYVTWLGVSSAEEAVMKLCGPDGQSSAQAWLNSLLGVERYETRRRRAATLRALADLGLSWGFGGWRGFFEVPKTTLHDMRGPSIEMIHRILATCGEDAEGVRNRALVMLLGVLALRSCEVRRILVADYDRTTRRLTVLSKGGNRHTVTVPVVAAKTLEKWIDLDKPSNAVFHAPGRSTPLSHAGVCHIFKQISSKTGERVVAAGFRHVGITIAMQEKFPWKSIRAYSRHKNPTGPLDYDDSFEPGEDRTVGHEVVAALESPAGGVTQVPPERIADKVAEKLMKGVKK